MQELLILDGKGFYVWSAYAITMISLVVALVSASMRKKKIIKEIDESLEQ
ncbi:MAG: heme exporter protein CcmD [Gammaproteobacteria bacterium]|nr:heme exporter protein CcmD [Gammaproteobacteria bacterium]